MHQLGQFLHDHRHEAGLKFVVREQTPQWKTFKHIPIPPETILLMMKQRIFEMPPASIPISEKLSDTHISLDLSIGKVYPISGFPRKLFSDENTYMRKIVFSDTYVAYAKSYIASRRPASFDGNRWAGSSALRRKAVGTAGDWRPPVPPKDSDHQFTPPTPIYSNPMESQRHILIPGAKLKKRARSSLPGGKPRVRIAYHHVRLAFRALFSPASSLSPPSYEDWVTNLPAGSDCSRAAYHRLYQDLSDVPASHLPDIQSPGQETFPELETVRQIVEAAMGDDTEYQADPAQSLVYHTWLQALQLEQNYADARESARRPHELEHELEGCIPPILELDEYSAIGRLDLTRCGEFYKPDY
jgi:hypothetical protein